MLSKTHLAIGIAAAVSILAPSTTRDLLPVIAGGAAGSLICDIDRRSKPRMRDALMGRVIAAVITSSAVVIDAYTDGSIMQYLESADPRIWAGAAILLTTLIAARYSEHRGFSHSLLALILYAAGIYILCPPVAPSFCIACVSHILIDMTNKKSLRFLFPSRRGFCLRWFYANKMANRVFMIAGLLWLAVALYLNG